MYGCIIGLGGGDVSMLARLIQRVFELSLEVALIGTCIEGIGEVMLLNG